MYPFSCLPSQRTLIHVCTRALYISGLQSENTLANPVGMLRWAGTGKCLFTATTKPFPMFQDLYFRNLVAKQCIPLAHSDRVEMVISPGDSETHKATRRQLSQTRSEARTDMDHDCHSTSAFCRQSGAEVALVQVTLPAHPTGTRSPGVAVKRSVQSKLLYRGSEPADRCWRKISSCRCSVFLQQLLSPLDQKCGQTCKLSRTTTTLLPTPF